MQRLSLGVALPYWDVESVEIIKYIKNSQT